MIRGCKLIDGATRAVRVGIELFLGATPLPVIVGLWGAPTKHPPLPNWGGFLGASGAYYAAIAAAVTGLIQLTDWSEPRAPPRLLRQVQTAAHNPSAPSTSSVAIFRSKRRCGVGKLPINTSSSSGTVAAGCAPFSPSARPAKNSPSGTPITFAN